MIPVQRIIGSKGISCNPISKEQIPKEIDSLRDEVEQALRKAGFYSLEVFIKFGDDGMPMVMLRGKFPKNRYPEFEKAFAPFKENPNIQYSSMETEDLVELFAAA